MSIPFNVPCDEEVVRALFAAFASTSGDEAPLSELNASHTVEKADLEKSLTVFAEKLADAEHCIQGFEHNNDTLDDL